MTQHWDEGVLVDYIGDECSDQVRGKWTSNNEYSVQWRELVGLSIGAELVASASHIGRSKKRSRDFPGGAVVKNLPANAGDMGSIPGPGRSHMPRSN